MTGPREAIGISINHERGRVVIRLHGEGEEVIAFFRAEPSGGLVIAEKATSCTQAAIAVGDRGPSEAVH